MRKHLVLIACLASISCSDDFRMPFVYRIDIHQGNIFTQDMVNQLKPGMTKRQVAFIMGTPLIQDAFHSNRWDYVYSNEPGSEDRLVKKFTVFFEADALVGVEGDLRPTDLPASDAKKDVTVVIPKIQRDKTVWEAITGMFGD
ncbi:MAG: outer membrane protein assembly factor BamE [Candidatus Methylumidiphilus sp.]|nr:outer membrane protein assembly factor BamE [Pseudomonadota bacterium]